MPTAKAKVANPPPSRLPRVKSLADLRSIRAECAALYRQAKAGRIEAGLFGRLTHCLGVLAGLIRDDALEARLSALEEAAAADAAHWSEPVSGRRQSIRDPIH